MNPWKELCNLLSRLKDEPDEHAAGGHEGAWYDAIDKDIEEQERLERKDNGKYRTW